MSITYVIQKKVFLILFILALWGYDAIAQRNDEKTKYIGIYESEFNFMNPTDTLSATMFFTHDSVTLVYMIQNDFDYLYPMYKGTWAVIVGEENDHAELKFGHVVMITESFEEFETPFGKSLKFYLNDRSYYQPTRIMNRRNGKRK